MSDRLLIAGAGVPLLCGVVALVLLQRAPGIHAGSVQAADLTYGAANADGRVDAVFVRSGARVKRGDRLLQFDARDSANSVGMAHADLAQRMSEVTRLQARALAASTQLKRLREGETWLSKQELDNANAEARMADAELQAARGAVGASRLSLSQARLRATRQTLTAPFSGVVVSLDVDAGASVTAGQIVVRVSSEDRQVRFAFPPGELPPSGEQRILVQLAGTEHVVPSSVAAVRPELDPSAQLVFATAPLPAALPEAERWIPGAAVQVRQAVSQPE
jgi:RND family efflux transporter MFP subunit